jgi:membrane protease YdiL (CAAX protease family)
MERIVLDAPARAAALPPPAYPTIKESWGILGWYLLVTIVVGVPCFLILEKLLLLSRAVSSLALIGVLNVALLGFLRWKAANRWQPLTLMGKEQRWLYAALPVLVLALATVLSVQSYLHLPNTHAALFTSIAKLPGLGLVMIVIVGPVLEELLFRGVVLQGLLRSQRPWIAIGQSALLFGIIHFNPAQSVNAFFLGLVFGWLYYRTRSLLLCMATHGLYNSLGFAGMWAAASSRTPNVSLLSTSPALYAGVVLLSALILGGILWRVHQTTEPEPAAAAEPAAKAATGAVELV